MDGDERTNRTKNEIIELIAKDRILEDIIINITGEIGADEQDLVQDLYLDLLSKPSQKLVDMEQRGELRWFLTRMVLNNIRSSNSRFFYKYKKNTNYINIDDIKDKI